MAVRPVSPRLNQGRVYSKAALTPLVPGGRYQSLYQRIAANRAAFLNSQPQTAYDVSNPLVTKRVRDQYGIKDETWKAVTESLGAGIGTGIGALRGAKVGFHVGSMISGAVGGAKVGAASAVVAGQAGPQAALPEEVVTVPVLAIIGAIVGTAVGAVSGFQTGKAVGGLASPSGMVIASELIRNTMIDASKNPVNAVGVAAVMTGTQIAARYIPVKSTVLKMVAAQLATRAGIQAFQTASDAITGQPNSLNNAPGMSSLAIVGNTMDNLSGATVIKSMLASASGDEEDFSTILQKAYGYHEEGFTQLDFSRVRKNLNINFGTLGNAAIDFIGEMASDPGIWYSVATGGIESEINQRTENVLDFESINVTDPSLKTILETMTTAQKRSLGHSVAERIFDEAKNTTLINRLLKKTSNNGFEAFRERMMIIIRDNGHTPINMDQMKDLFDVVSTRVSEGINPRAVDAALIKENVTKKIDAHYKKLNQTLSDVEKNYRIDQMVAADMKRYTSRVSSRDWSEISSQYAVMKLADARDDLANQILLGVFNPGIMLFRQGPNGIPSGMQGITALWRVVKGSTAIYDVNDKNGKVKLNSEYVKAVKAQQEMLAETQKVLAETQKAAILEQEKAELDTLAKEYEVAKNEQNIERTEIYKKYQQERLEVHKLYHEETKRIDQEFKDAREALDKALEDMKLYNFRRDLNDDEFIDKDTVKAYEERLKELKDDTSLDAEEEKQNLSKQIEAYNNIEMYKTLSEMKYIPYLYYRVTHGHIRNLRGLLEENFNYEIRRSGEVSRMRDGVLETKDIRNASAGFIADARKQYVDNDVRYKYAQDEEQKLLDVLEKSLTNPINNYGAEIQIIERIVRDAKRTKALYTSGKSTWAKHKPGKVGIVAVHEYVDQVVNKDKGLIPNNTGKLPPPPRPMRHDAVKEVRLGRDIFQNDRSYDLVKNEELFNMFGIDLDDFQDRVLGRNDKTFDVTFQDSGEQSRGLDIRGYLKGTEFVKLDDRVGVSIEQKLNDFIDSMGLSVDFFDDILKAVEDGTTTKVVEKLLEDRMVELVEDYVLLNAIEIKELAEQKLGRGNSGRGTIDGEELLDYLNLNNYGIASMGKEAFLEQMRNVFGELDEGNLYKAFVQGKIANFFIKGTNSRWADFLSSQDKHDLALIQRTYGTDEITPDVVVSYKTVQRLFEMEKTVKRQFNHLQLNKMFLFNELASSDDVMNLLGDLDIAFSGDTGYSGRNIWLDSIAMNHEKFANDPHFMQMQSNVHSALVSFRRYRNLVARLKSASVQQLGHIHDILHNPRLYELMIDANGKYLTEEDFVNKLEYNMRRYESYDEEVVALVKEQLTMEFNSIVRYGRHSQYYGFNPMQELNAASINDMVTFFQQIKSEFRDESRDSAVVDRSAEMDIMDSFVFEELIPTLRTPFARYRRANKYLSNFVGDDKVYKRVVTSGTNISKLARDASPFVVKTSDNAKITKTVKGRLAVYNDYLQKEVSFGTAVNPKPDLAGLDYKNATVAYQEFMNGIMAIIPEGLKYDGDYNSMPEETANYLAKETRLYLRFASDKIKAGGFTNHDLAVGNYFYRKYTGSTLDGDSEKGMMGLYLANKNETLDNIYAEYDTYQQLKETVRTRFEELEAVTAKMFDGKDDEVKELLETEKELATDPVIVSLQKELDSLELSPAPRNEVYDKHVKDTKQKMRDHVTAKYLGYHRQFSTVSKIIGRIRGYGMEAFNLPEVIDLMQNLEDRTLFTKLMDIKVKGVMSENEFNDINEYTESILINYSKAYPLLDYLEESTDFDMNALIAKIPDGRSKEKMLELKNVDDALKKALKDFDDNKYDIDEKFKNDSAEIREKYRKRIGKFMSPNVREHIQDITNEFIKEEVVDFDGLQNMLNNYLLSHNIPTKDAQAYAIEYTESIRSIIGSYETTVNKHYKDNFVRTWDAVEGKYVFSITNNFEYKISVDADGRHHLKKEFILDPNQVNTYNNFDKSMHRSELIEPHIDRIVSDVEAFKAASLKETIPYPGVVLEDEVIAKKALDALAQGKQIDFGKKDTTFVEGTDKIYTKAAEETERFRDTLYNARFIKERTADRVNKHYKMSLDDLKIFFSHKDGKVDYEQLLKFLQNSREYRLVMTTTSRTKRVRSSSRLTPESTVETKHGAMEKAMVEAGEFKEGNPSIVEMSFKSAEDLAAELEFFEKGDAIGLMSIDDLKSARKDTIVPYKLPPILQYYTETIQRVQKFLMLFRLGFHPRNIIDIMRKNSNILGTINDTDTYVQMFGRAAKSYDYWYKLQGEMVNKKLALRETLNKLDANVDVTKDVTDIVSELQHRIDYLNRQLKSYGPVPTGDLEYQRTRDLKEFLDVQKMLSDISKATDKTTLINALKLVYADYGTIGTGAYLRQVHSNGLSFAELEARGLDNLNETDIETQVYLKLQKSKRFRNASDVEKQVMFRDGLNDFIHMQGIVNRFQNTSAATDYNKILLKSNEYADEHMPLDRQVVDYITNMNPISKGYRMIGQYVEQIGRLHSYMLEQHLYGADHDMATTSTLNRHFDYSDSSELETWAGAFIPFVAYPVRNGLYYADLMTKAATTRTWYNAITALWGGYEEDEENEFVRYAKLNGYVPIGNTFVKLGDARGGAFGMFLQPGTEIKSRLNPIIRDVSDSLMGLSPSVKNSISALPGVATAQAIRSHKQRNSSPLATIAPSMFANRYHYEAQPYKDRFRNVYRDLYTAKGKLRTPSTDGYYRVRSIMYDIQSRRYSR